MADELPVTSPTLPTPDTLVKSGAQFSGTQTLDLTDDEIQRAWRIIQSIRSKWMGRFRSKFRALPENKVSQALEEAMKLVEQFEDELKTELMEKVDILATVNVLPVLEGQPIEIEFIGKMPGSDLYKYGMDHEKKAWEVKQANARDEAFLGESDG